MASVSSRGRPDDDTEKCLIIVQKLKEKGINFVCIDFDQTIVNVHTYGRWSGPPEELVHHIRPFFKKFIPLLIHNGIFVSVVTFSVQVGLTQW